MKRFTQIFPILLAVTLQIMPLVRNLFLRPVAGTNLAYFLRLGVGTSLGLGAVDAVSGASSPVDFSSSPYFSGTVGVYYTNSITLVGNGGDAGDYFLLNNATIFSAQLTDGMSTTSCLPNGLILKVFNSNFGGAPQPIYCAIYGIPTTPVSALWVRVTTGFPAQTPTSQDTYFTMVGQTPTITNQPVGVTNAAGGNASFSVKAGGAPAPVFQWRVGPVAIAGATNATLTRTNIRVGQAGNYVVVVTNSIGSVTSSVVVLAVTNPNPPKITGSGKNGAQYQFTFVPVPGLTNSVQTNRVPSGGTWGVLTNVPPPSNSGPVTITDLLGVSNRFYRVQIVP